MANKKITWSHTSLLQFNAAIEYILGNSVQNAEHVRSERLDKVDQLIASPEMHPADKYKTENDGTYRAFELHHYRVSYRIMAYEIKIVRVRHTSMTPKSH